MKTWYKWLSMILCVVFVWNGCGPWQGNALASTVARSDVYIDEDTPDLGSVMVNGIEIRHIAKIEEESSENVTVYQNIDGSRTMYITADDSRMTHQENIRIGRMDERAKAKERPKMANTRAVTALSE